MFGRPYKDELDYVIADILFHKGPCRYKELKVRVEQYLISERTISDSTFVRHLKRMEMGKVLTKGGLYNLTRECRNVMEKGGQIDTSKYRYRNRPLGINAWDTIPKGGLP
jgi:hypothetical protein